MGEFVSVLNTTIYGALAVVFVASVLRAFQKRKAQAVEAGKIKLPFRTWAVVAPLLILITLIDKPALRRIEQLQYEALIPPTDHNRLSVLIPDFAGEGGATAADEVKYMLQTSLGDGVQILRIPALPPQQRYGDAEVQNGNTMVDSLKCAARYNADVVVWGTNLPGAGHVRVSYTAKGGVCRLQERCGVVPGRVPAAYERSDTKSPTSPMSLALSQSVVRSLMLAVDVNGEEARPQACLADPNVARLYMTKAERLLRGDPKGLSPDSHEMAVSLAGMFHGELFKKTGDLRHLDRAIALLEGEIARRPDAVPRLGRALAFVLTERAKKASAASQIHSAVARLDQLAVQVGAAGIRNIQNDAAALLEFSYYKFGDRSILPDLRRRFRGLLGTSAADSQEVLHLNTRLFGIEANELQQAPGPARYHAAAIYRTPVYRALDSVPTGQVSRVWIGDRCTLARGDLELEQFRKDPYENTRTVNRVTSLFTLSEIDWNHSECTEAVRRLGEMYAQLHRLGMDSPEATLLRAHVDCELQIFRFDKTQAKWFNRQRLALALADLARATRSPLDRKHAVDVLKVSILEAAKLNDPAAGAALRQELGSVLAGA